MKCGAVSSDTGLHCTSRGEAVSRRIAKKVRAMFLFAFTAKPRCFSSRPAIGTPIFSAMSLDFQYGAMKRDTPTAAYMGTSRCAWSSHPTRHGSAAQIRRGFCFVPARRHPLYQTHHRSGNSKEHYWQEEMEQSAEYLMQFQRRSIRLSVRI